MPRVEFLVDEKDKGPDRGNPLRVEGVAPGMVGRWVRTKGHDADGHMSRMREMGYVPVERNAKTERSGDDARLKSGQHAQTDGTIKRGDLMLMQISKEQHEKHRRAMREYTERVTKGSLNRLKQMGGYEEK